MVGNKSVAGSAYSDKSVEVAIQEHVSIKIFILYERSTESDDSTFLIQVSVRVDHFTKTKPRSGPAP